MIQDISDRSQSDNTLAVARYDLVMRTGLIIAGGRSSRFGAEDKVVASFAGTPMVRRVADALWETVDDIVVNCRKEQIEQIASALDSFSPEVTFATDPEPDEGPLAGIRTGIRAAETEFTAVVAADMPFVDPAFIEYLFERADDHDGAVPRLQDGFYQPIQAVYRTESMATAADRALGRNESRIVAAFEDLDVVVVTEDEVRRQASLETFENVNTREEFVAATERLGED